MPFTLCVICFRLQNGHVGANSPEMLTILLDKLGDTMLKQSTSLSHGQYRQSWRCQGDIGDSSKPDLVLINAHFKQFISAAGYDLACNLFQPSFVGDAFCQGCLHEVNSTELLGLDISAIGCTLCNCTAAGCIHICLTSSGCELSVSHV